MNQTVNDSLAPRELLSSTGQTWGGLRGLSVCIEVGNVPPLGECSLCSRFAWFCFAVCMMACKRMLQRSGVAEEWGWDVGLIPALSLLCLCDLQHIIGSLPLSSPAVCRFACFSCLIAGRLGKRFCSSVRGLNLAQKALVPAVTAIQAACFFSRSAGIKQTGTHTETLHFFPTLCTQHNAPRLQ